MPATVERPAAQPHLFGDELREITATVKITCLHCSASLVLTFSNPPLDREIVSQSAQLAQERGWSIQPTLCAACATAVEFNPRS